jgi:putative transcriptional regulator
MRGNLPGFGWDHGEVEDSTRGRLLVATPDLRDPNFSRTVVLMLEHSDEGALGVVLNRPVDLRVEEVLPDWAAQASAPACLFVGGPVSPSSAIGLGRGAGDGLDVLFDGLGTLDLDLEDGGSPPDIADLRIFVGYSGWSPGQLEQELQAGGWLVLDLLPEDPFTADPSQLWTRVLKRQGGRTAMFALAPDDPSTN